MLPIALVMGRYGCVYGRTARVTRMGGGEIHLAYLHANECVTRFLLSPYTKNNFLENISFYADSFAEDLCYVISAVTTAAPSIPLSKICKYNLNTITSSIITITITEINLNDSQACSSAMTVTGGFHEAYSAENINYCIYTNYTTYIDHNLQAAYDTDVSAPFKVGIAVYHNVDTDDASETAGIYEFSISDSNSEQHSILIKNKFSNLKSV